MGIFTKERRVTEGAFRVTYSGERLDDHAIDAFEFAESLIGLVDSFRIASDHTIENPKDRPKLQVKQTGAGSFWVDLVLVRESGFLDFAVEALNSREATAVGNASGLVGLVTIAYTFIKKFGPRKPLNAIPSDDLKTINVELEDGSTIQIDNETWDLVQNANFRKAAKKAVKIVREGEAQEMTITPASELGLPAVNVNEMEAQRFDFEKEPDAIKPTTTDETVFVKFDTFSFNTNNKYRIIWENRTYSVSMLDEEFSKKINNGEIRVGKYDEFKVHLRTIEEDQLNGSTKVIRQIVKVYDQVSGHHEQEPLPEPPEG